MDNIPETFTSYFNKKYTKIGYLDKYGGSVIMTMLTLFFFFIIISYYFIKDKIEPIRQNWTEERCKPSVMAFAGFINAPKGTSKTQYAAENFMQCTNIILSNIVGYFVKPIYFITENLGESIQGIIKSLDFFRIILAWLRQKLMKIHSYLFARLYNVIVPVQKILIKFKDLLHKIAGVAITGLYTIYGLYLAMRSFVGAFLQILIICLIVLLALIVVLWILPFTWPTAIAGTAFFTLISIPVAITAGWMDYILNINSRKVPKRKCFDKNTLIDTVDGKIKIKDLKSGTTLKNGDRVTSVFKLTINDVHMYNLDGIIVSGCHKIFHKHLGWIDVKEHPLSRKLNDYDENIIYCFSTESKRINIDNYKFLDWDELEPVDIIKLKNLKYLSHKSSLADIHKYLESGLDGNILIELENGQSIKLKNLELNDHLKFDERVIGLVEIDTKNIDYVSKYSFNNFSIIGAPNLHFNDIDLGNFNTLNIAGKKIKKPKKLYHLITDSGYFTVDSVKLRDYNSAIENILDIRDKLFALF